MVEVTSCLRVGSTCQRLKPGGQEPPAHSSQAYSVGKGMVRFLEGMESRFIGLQRLLILTDVGGFPSGAASRILKVACMTCG